MATEKLETLHEAEGEKKRKVTVETPLPYAPKQRFRVGQVKDVIRDVLREKLKGVNYDPETAPGVARDLADAVKHRLRELEFERYKIVVQVAVGEIRGQSLQMASRCFWDLETDDYAEATYMDNNVFGVAVAFGMFLY